MLRQEELRGFQGLGFRLVSQEEVCGLGFGIFQQQKVCLGFGDITPRRS